MTSSDFNAWILGRRLYDIEESSKARDQKLDILKAKFLQLEEQISSEKAAEQALNSIFPPKYSPDMKISEMNHGFKRCLQLLKSFYDSERHNEASIRELWSNLRTVLRSIPNIFAFQAILRQMDVQNSALAQVDSSLLEKKDSSINPLISKMNLQLILSGIECVSRKNKLQEIKSLCSEKIQSVTNELEGICSSSEFSFQYDEDDDVVGDFVSVMLKYLNIQGKLAHGTALVTQLKPQVEENISAKQYEIVTQERLNINNELKSKISTVQQTIAQIWQMKEKVNLGKISMLHMVQDLKNNCKNQEMNRTIMNSTLLAESSGPDHVGELKLFIETPITNFDSTSDEVAFEFDRIQLMQSSEIVSLLFNLRFGDVMNIRHFLESMQRSFELSQKLQSALAVKIDPKVEEIPESALSELCKQRDRNRETVCEILDRILKVNVNTKSILREFDVLYKFALKNPLKHFIDPSQKFLGKSYKEYESEFNLYYNMTKDWRNFLVAIRNGGAQ